MTTLFAALVLAPAPLILQQQGERPVRDVFVTEWRQQAGTQYVQFQLPEGKITVYLPDTIVAGDKISGSVFAEGSGMTGGERSRYESILRDYQVSVDGTVTKLGSALFTVQVPQDADLVEVILRDPSGQPLDQATAKTSANAGRANSFVAYPVFQRGSAIEVLGPFDGDRRTTTATLGGEKIGVLTESPRACVVSAGMLGAGPLGLSVTESGREYSRQVNSVSLIISTPDKDPRVGQKAQVSLDLHGLADVSSDAFPITIVLVNHTPEIVRFVDSETDRLEVKVLYDEVVNGRWTGSIPIKPLKRAEYLLSGSVKNGLR